MESILRALSSDDATERVRAAAACEALGPDAAQFVPVLVALLEGEVADWDGEMLRHRVIKALEMIGPAARHAVAALIELLHGLDNPDVPTVHVVHGITACAALGAIGDPAAIPALRICLQASGDDFLRWLSLAAAEALWRISGDHEPALAVATGMLRDEDWLRCHSIDVLACLGPPALAVLAKLVNDDNAGVARHAREALAAISSGKPSRPFRPAMLIVDAEAT